MDKYLLELVKNKESRLKEKKLLKDFELEILKKKAKEIAKREIQKGEKINLFKNALAKEGLSIIGELKKASPSKGMIREDFDVSILAKEYENVVDAISVLTEESMFLGSDTNLKKVSREVATPILCKDFIIDIIQIYNAKILGASAILLIVNILDDQKLREFYRTAKNLNMDVLVETHSSEEIERAVDLGADIIGINNRDLNSFETKLENTVMLRKLIPEDRIVISESGIRTEEDIKYLSKVKINGVLVGESFMKAESIKTQAELIKNAYRGVDFYEV